MDMLSTHLRIQLEEAGYGRCTVTAAFNGNADDGVSFHGQITDLASIANRLDLSRQVKKLVELAELAGACYKVRRLADSHDSAAILVYPSKEFSEPTLTS